MVEVIHEREVSNANNAGFLVGILLLIAALFLFFYYGAALFRNVDTTPQVTVPEQIDVNVNQQPQP